jgi:hypothetical protein
VQLNAIIYNKLNEEIGKAVKQITVFDEYQIRISGLHSTNNNIIINNEKLLLMPPNSDIALNQNAHISSVSPCNREDSMIKVFGDNHLASGESSSHP